MVISGQFRDLKNNLISVEIFNPSQEGDYPIDDYFYTDNNNNPNAGHFCFDGKSPVKISRKNDDLFDPVFSTSCKIKLRSNIWCGDLLFADGVGSIICKVERQKHNQQTGQDSLTKDLLFVGYVQPLSFNQNINKTTNIIDINCVDLLGFLKDKYLSTGLQPQSDDTESEQTIAQSQRDTAWKKAISMAQYRTFPELLEKIGVYNTEFDFSDTTLTTKMYIQRDKDIIASDLNISDNLWLGESADDETAMSDILVELMKYLNCRIVSINGLDYYIIDNGMLLSDDIADTSINGMYCYVGENKQWVEFDDTVVLPKQDIANEQVSIDSCYNKIGIKCELETVDDVIPNPLDEQNFQSKFTNKQIFMREYVCDDTEGGRGSSGEIVWKSAIFAGKLPDELPTGQAQEAGTKLWIRDHYLRILENQNWTLNNNYIPSKSDGKNIKQYESLIKMNDLYYQVNSHAQNEQYDWFDPSTTTLNINPFFVSYGSGEKRTILNPDEKGQITTKNILVIPCPETWLWGYGNGNSLITEAQAFSWINDQLAKYENNPIIKYNSGTSINLTPSDNSITNYLIFNGKIKLIPSYRGFNGTVPGDELQYRGTSTDWSKQNMIYQNTFGNRDWFPAIASDKDKTRWYYQQYYTRTNPSNGTIYITHENGEQDVTGIYGWETCAVDPDAPKMRNGQLFYIDIPDAYGKQFGWGITKTKKYHSNYINMRWVSVLQCRLRIGDKYLREDYEGEADSDAPIFTWSTDPTSTFTLSVKPKMPDDGADPSHYLVGEEYEIMNNVTNDMNLTTDGTAIPITFDDKLAGDLQFEIIAPFNATVNTVDHYYKHGTWFRDAEIFDSQTDVSLLNHIHSINITDFSMKCESDNAKNATLNSGDLLYYSEDNKMYNNVKDNIEFKIVTALDGEEAAKLNVAAGISFNNPTDSEGNLHTTSYEDRPECNYINTMYYLYSTPKKLVEYTCNDDTPIDEIYRSIYSCDLMSHLNVESFNSIVLANEMDLKNNRIKITLREV